MRWLPSVLGLCLVACSSDGDDALESVRLVDATACSDIQVLLVTADETQAVRVNVTREQREARHNATEFDLSDLDAELLTGEHLSGAGCTDDRGTMQVDGSEAVDVGTLTLAVEDGRADIALRGARSSATAIEDVEFAGEVVGPTPG